MDCIISWRALQSVGMKWLNKFAILIFRISLVIGIVVFTLILKSQLFSLFSSSIDAISYLLVIILAFVVIEHLVRKKIKSKYVLILSAIIMVLSIIVGIVIVNSFLAPLIVEPSYV